MSKDKKTIKEDSKQKERKYKLKPQNVNTKRIGVFQINKDTYYKH